MEKDGDHAQKSSLVKSVTSRCRTNLFKGTKPLVLCESVCAFSRKMDGGSGSSDYQESRPQYLQLRDVRETTDSSCDDQSTKLHNLPFQYLKEITNSFSDERVLRNGIFGVVYKGMLQNGEIIAVEKLVTSKPGFQKQFENECCHLMKLRHPNVVPFVGYCYETHKIFMESNGRAEKPIFVEMAERLLCSEYQPKGSLDKYLSDESSGFDWQERYRIIEGICYGLHYLQEQTDHQPIFLKPASIMLDDYTIPKITDFGISKFFHQQTKTLDSNTTLSYMAPEYTHGGTITLKSDIFSLGVIILEIMTGKRGFPDVSRISSDDFIKLVDEKLKTTLEKAQSFTTSEEIDCDEIKRCIQIGLICVNPQKTKRPTTRRIIKMLHRLESTDCHFRNETETTSSLRVMTAMEAPMSSSLGAMGPLLSKLVSLLPPKYRVPKPLTEVIALLKEDLDEISTALLEQSIIHVPNSMTKLWMGEVRELSYDIEDFIDDIMQGYGVRPRFQRRKLRQMHAGADAKARYLQGYRVGNVKIAWAPKAPKLFAKITEFRTLLQQASEWYYRYLDGCTTSSRCVFTVHGQVLAPYGKAANYLVGIEETKTKLIELLTDEEHQQLKVVSIVGPAGVGKTTLAKQVYSELGRRFECRAFVRASRKPDMRRLLGGILSQVQWRPGPSDSCTVQDLIDNLAEYLQDKRYIIVVDDLWETTAWDILTSAFPDGNNRSRIITTAEIEGVALESCDYESNNILKMKPLGGKNSGKLFLNLVFGPEITCPEQLKEVSDIIISRCSGLPLAIVCVTGLLASQPDNSELWQHVQQSLCFSLSTDSSLEETLQEILKLSYNSTPHDLKTCLMYLGMYPEDRTIWKVDLVNQWITEGFINATEGEDAEEVAESYFGELVSRGLIQPVEVTDNGEVLSCTVNHVVLDMITERSNEEKFITTLDYSQTITGLYGNARRLSLHFSNARYATKPKGLALSKIRSLAFFGIIKCMPSIVEFKLLRVVILEFWGDHQGSMSLDLTRICRLFQLRYLKISCDASKEVELPTQMQMLRYLETLIIDATVSAVPFGIIHLPGSVRTLHYINSGSNSEDNTFSLSKLMNLQNLHITYNREKSNEHLKENLAALKKDVDTLTGLPALTSLSLYILQPTTRSIIFKRGAFPALKNFKYTCDVLSLAFQEEAFPNLQRLELSFNAHKGEQYEHLVTGIEYMLNLKEIAGTIGAAAGAEEPDRRAAESALNEAIRKHPKFPSYKIVSRADEGEWPHGKYVGEEPDRRAAESALNEAIRKHPRFPSHKIVSRADEGEWPQGKYVGEEPDRRVAESALNEVIRKHPRFPSYKIVSRADKGEWPHGKYVSEYIVNHQEKYVERGLPNGDFYTGEWRAGAPHGAGKYLWMDGCMYEGEWRHGKATGRGKLSWPSGATYVGEFKDGFMDGYGTYTGAAGDTYNGAWSMNLKHGGGRKSYANGDQYDGEWRSGLQDGAGRYIWRNGTEYTGEWRAGLMHGRGVLAWANGNRYSGGWEDGCPRGQGTFRWADGSVYVGFWTRDSQKGVYYPSPAASSPTARDPRDVFARELPGFMASGDDRKYDKISIWESITCDTVDGAVLVDEEDGAEGGTFLPPPSPAPRIAKWVSQWQAKQQGETIVKGHKHYELMFNLQLGIRHSVGKQGPVTLELKSSAFDPKEKVWTKFPREGSKHTMQHNSCDFRWKDYCPQVFRTLRKLFKVNAADYMLSLCGSEALRELSFSGKSGSFFYLTNDDQYMIKTMKKSEVKMLLKMLPAYYNHVRAFEDTLLTKFFGLHCVKLAGANQKKVRFVIMGNVFCSDNSIHRRFDLKGSSLGRTTDESQTEIDQYTILKDLDLNLIFRLKRQWFQEFQRQVDRDCDFLEQEKIMDYSLLVGVHFRHNGENLPTEGCTDKDINTVSTLRFSRGYTDQLLADPNGLSKIKLGTSMPARAELTARKNDCEPQLIGEPTGEYCNVILYFGIIDILQDYDISKKLEHAYKSFQYDPTSISAVDPKQYSRRFKDFIYRAFQEDS